MAATSHRTQQERRRAGAAAAPAPARSDTLPLQLPFALTIGLALIAFVPRVQSNPTLALSVWAAAGALVAWELGLFVRPGAALAGPALRVELRSQHYIQAIVQLAVYTYWGWYWRPVYDMAWLLVAQLAFAYAFDMLLAWSRREGYVLGFGPFPIIFSTNLFLWFRDDWFYLQFVMIAVGFMGKAFVRWHREGRRVHIFNPSAFSLGLFSLALILTNTTDLTWGQDIATTLTLAPRIYLFLFLIGLVVMYFFSITLVAGAAAAVLFGLSAAYAATTGVPYFIDSEIPTAVFLGLHLLVTDPSTSPRTPPGKLVFGVLYGLGVFGLYALLGAIGVPTFYDKLLCVPLLNLSMQRIDGFVRAAQSRPGAQRRRLARVWSAGNLAHMGVWILFFGSMSYAGATDGRHPGDEVPFWQRACANELRDGCVRLVEIESSYCADNSGWACNELGLHYTRGAIVTADPARALSYFSRACEARFAPACLNLLAPDEERVAPPRALDLRLLLREGGRNLVDMPEPELYARACEHGWAFACDRASSAQ